MIRLLTLCLLYLVCLATPASAGPVAAAIGMAFTAIKGSVVLSALFKLAASVVLSKISAALAPKPKQPGIKTESTLTGSQAPCSFVLGSYATAGAYVCPPMSHGSFGDYPNAYLTYVIELGDIAGQTLDQVIINGEVVPFGGAPHADYGLPVSSGKYLGKAWLKYYDGTQTTADPMLLAKYGSYPKRPWSADMVGRGICYAILTFQYGRDVYSSFPSVRFVVGGIKLYDPRKDSTVGGSGSHRWATPSTWAATLNPVVMAYNIHRGINVAGHVWGGNASAAELPLSSWFAAMNACDALVDNGAGGTEPAFRAGYEVTVDMEPAAVLEDLMRACLGEVADVGGEWLVSAGDTALPVFLLTDDGVVTSQPGEQVPFPAPQDTFNAVLANYPDPAAGWEAQAAPPLYNATWEAADGGRRLPVTLDFPAVPYAAQVQRLMRATIAQERRFVTHTEVLPPEALPYDVLDVGSWTSARHGYGSKLFQIGRTAEDLKTGLVQVTMRERDPADSTIPTGYYQEPQVVPAAPSSAPGQIVVGEADLAQTVLDRIDAAADQAAREFGIEAVTSLPMAGVREDQIVLKKPELVLYRWAGPVIGWTTDLYAGVADGSVTAAKVAAGAITAGALAAGSVVASKIAAGAVTADKISVSSLDAISANLGTIQVGSANIAVGAITSANIGDAQITTAKIADTLQSTNFVAGSAGWQIQKSGAAEFNSLIVRRGNLAAGSTVVGNGGSSATSTTVSTTTYTDVLSTTVTTTGGKVLIIADVALAGSSGPKVAILRGSSTLFEKVLGGYSNIFSGDGTIMFFDSPAAGTYTYHLGIAKNASGSSNLTVTNRSIAAIEFKQA